MTVSPASLTFTSGNWATAQTVTVTAVVDDIIEGTETHTITHSITATTDHELSHHSDDRQRHRNRV